MHRVGEDRKQRPLARSSGMDRSRFPSGYALSKVESARMACEQMRMTSFGVGPVTHLIGRMDMWRLRGFTLTLFAVAACTSGTKTTTLSNSSSASGTTTVTSGSGTTGTSSGTTATNSGSTTSTGSSGSCQGLACQSNADCPSGTDPSYICSSGCCVINCNAQHQCGIAASTGGVNGNGNNSGTSATTGTTSTHGTNSTTGTNGSTNGSTGANSSGSGGSSGGAECTQCSGCSDVNSDQCSPGCTDGQICCPWSGGACQITDAGTCQSPGGFSCATPTSAGACPDQCYP